MADDPSETDPRSRALDLGEAMRIGAQDEFWAIRGHAVQAYANLEQSLCRLFGALGTIPDVTASTVFFRITSTQVRNAILEQLFKQKYNANYNLFRNSLISQLRPVDIERNEIVHWNVVNEIDRAEDGTPIVEVVLQPPQHVATTDMRDRPRKTKQEMLAFITKCDFYGRLCNMFGMFTINVGFPAMSEHDKNAWLDIFQKPIVYPPPTDHPLLQPPQTLEIPLPPSPA